MACQAARNLILAIPNSIAVVRPDNTILQEQLTAEGLEVITNLNYQQGMGSSIACGVMARPAAKGWVIALGDMPRIKVQTITQVTEKINTGELIAAPRTNQQQGHPVGFSSAFRDDLLALNGPKGGRRILADNINKISWVEVTDSGIHYDIDEPADILKKIELT